MGECVLCEPLCFCGGKKRTWHVKVTSRFCSIFLFSPLCPMWTLRADQQLYVLKPEHMCSHTRAYTWWHTLNPKVTEHVCSGSQFLFTFCHASTRPLSTFELLPNASTQNPLFILKSLIDPQYWLVSLSLLESKYFMYNWPVNGFTLNSLRWQVMFYLCVLSKLKRLIFCYGRT